MSKLIHYPHANASSCQLVLNLHDAVPVAEESRSRTGANFLQKKQALIQRVIPKLTEATQNRETVSFFRSYTLRFLSPFSVSYVQQGTF